MRVEELALAMVREVRGEDAVGRALPALVFTCSASVGGGVVGPWIVAHCLLGFILLIWACGRFLG